MKRILTAVCCFSMLSLPALAAQKHATKAPMTDQQFVDFAGQTDMVEANLGQLAEDAAAKQEVKDYGKMLVTDHTGDYQQLQDAAKQAGLNVPTAIDAKQDKTAIGPLHELKGAAFDHKYITLMIDGHMQAIAVYKKEAADAQSPVLKSYAENALPVLQKHLADAKDVKENKPMSVTSPGAQP